MTKRTLSLTRETLAELSDTDLGSVAGAVRDISGITCPLRDCLDNTYRICVQTENCPTLFC